MITSTTGHALVKGDRVLYLCQCGAAGCAVGERATVVSREEVAQHFSDEALQRDDLAFVKFDGEALPLGVVPGNLIHLSRLGVPLANQGPNWRELPSLRVLLVDETTVGQIADVAEHADIVIDVEAADGRAKVLKFPNGEFSKVDCLGVKHAAHVAEEGRTMREGLLAFSFAHANPGGQG